ncbi:MAG TPA: hypothetical protein VKM35_08750 [Arenimonas sp.]|uniref:hypothetical protein n=1 Tax=Arenimonas sp. TaxID=1872635 RepID=UPI002BA78973|nr:hypothetical protein [Arenimonas sp.]HMB57287.1 hypothetical protein [Arenimonas sp.]
MPRSLFRPIALLLLLLCLGLGACRRDVVAPGDPVAAVKGLAEAVHDNDLVRYSQLSLPPALHQQMEARWAAQLAVAPPPSAEEQQEYARWMTRLTEPGAEAKLYRDLDPKLRKFEAELGSQWPMMKATGGIFVKGVIQANDKLTPSEKDHALAVSGAVLDWLKPQLFSDRDRAHQAIAVLTATARQLDLPTLAQSRALAMGPALEKGGVLLKGLKAMALIYGVDADAALAGVQATVTRVDGDVATLKVSYPLLDKTVSFDMELIRRDGRWYRADAVRSAEAELAQPLTPPAPAR